MKLCEKIPEYLLAWYPAHARELPWRTDREPYHVWLSEIMLQQTRVEAVKGYYLRFLEALPSVAALAEAEERRLLKLWEGLGYYRRVKNLQKAAQMIMSQYDGIFPETYEEILSLPGIGEYTAGAIGSICFDLPTPAVDGNVLRVCTRVMDDASNIDMERTKKEIREALREIYPQERSGMFTQSLMELGATVCVPNGAPKCGACPLQEICQGYLRGSWQELPVRQPKKKRRLEEKTVWILECDGMVAMRQRQDPGLLQGMWEFPNENQVWDAQQSADVATGWGVAPKELVKSIAYTHIFTHVEWKMQGYYFLCKNKTPEFQWISRKDLEEIAVPSAFKPFVNGIEMFGDE